MLGFLLRWLVISVPAGIIIGKLLKATQTPSAQDELGEIELWPSEVNRP